MGLFGKKEKRSSREEGTEMKTAIKETHQALLQGEGVERSEGRIPPANHDYVVHGGAEPEDDYQARAAAAMMQHVADQDQQAQLTAVLQQEGKQMAVAAAKEAGKTAKVVAGKALSELSRYVEQGPDGVRVLAFMGGAACSIIAGLNLMNPFGILTAPLHYLICAYQMLFALTTMLMEMHPEWVEKVPYVSNYQEMLEDHAKFLLRVLGRGFFYFFTGSLWLSMGLFPYGVLGLYMMSMGGFYTAMHFGILPQNLIAVTQRALKQGIDGTQGLLNDNV